MKNQVEVKIETDKYAGEKYTETLIKTLTVTTYDKELYKIIKRITEFVKRNHNGNSRMTLRINSIGDPSRTNPLMSHIGGSIEKYKPFVILLGDEVTEPKDYDPIWV
jgi:hypothetical protein